MPSDIRFRRTRHLSGSSSSLIQLGFISLCALLLYFSLFISSTAPYSTSRGPGRRPRFKTRSQWLKFNDKKLPFHIDAESEYPSTTVTLKQLKGIKRTDKIGIEFQRRCGEDTTVMTDWITALSNPKLCEVDPPADGDVDVGVVGGGPAIDEEGLLESAKHQCGSWCVWDLRSTDEFKGWRLTGSACFEAFKSPHDCDEWIDQKPKIALLSRHHDPATTEAQENELDEAV